MPRQRVFTLRPLKARLGPISALNPYGALRMPALSNVLKNQLIDGLIRGGAVNSAGTVNSTAVITGIWAATTAYTVGQVIAPPATFTAGGGKFLLCTTAGTSGSTTTLACPAIGSTLADGTAVWTAISGIPSLPSIYVALFTISNGLRGNSTAYVVGNCISVTPAGGPGGDTKQHIYACTTAGTTAAAPPSTYLGVPNEAIVDGTAVFSEMSAIMAAGSGFPTGFAEVSGGAYARVATAATLAAWAGTQAAGSTTVSTGITGTTSNNAPVTFPAPTANWATGTTQIGAAGLYTTATGGSPLAMSALTVPKSVNNGDAAPSYATGSLTFQIDNSN